MDSVGGYVEYSFTLVDVSTIRDRIVPVGQHEEMSAYVGKAIRFRALLTTV